MIFDFFAQTFNVNVYSSGIANIFVAPDVVQKLLSGEYDWVRKQGNREAPAP